MKSYRFTWAFLFALVAAASVYTACHREPVTPAPPVGSTSGDEKIFSRTCEGPYCNCNITTDENTTLELCGDIPTSTTSCSFGCNSSTDTYASGTFLKNETRGLCFTAPGSLCIRNTGTTTVGVIVQFGSSTPISFTLAPNARHCVSSNACLSTDDDCL